MIIKEFYYHKTIKENEITHKIDLSNQFIGYNVDFNRTYFDKINKIEFYKDLLNDIKEILVKIELELDKEIKNENIRKFIKN